MIQTPYASLFSSPPSRSQWAAINFSRIMSAPAPIEALSLIEIQSLTWHLSDPSVLMLFPLPLNTQRLLMGETGEACVDGTKKESGRQHLREQ